MIVQVRRLTTVNPSALAHSPPSATSQIPLTASPPLVFHAAEAGPVKPRAARTEAHRIPILLSPF
ncbi:hypothetical protein BOTBODRAFT_34090, partial [Botryobasidium botryosum FD-172 SS1]